MLGEEVRYHAQHFRMMDHAWMAHVRDLDVAVVVDSVETHPLPASWRRKRQVLRTLQHARGDVVGADGREPLVAESGTHLSRIGCVPFTEGTDRDGMYVHVTAKGAMSFRMDYRLNGQRETIYLGKYAPDGLSLARAREKCIDARRNIAARLSTALALRHPFFRQFLFRAFVLGQLRQAHAAHVRSLGELDIVIANDLDAIAPRVAEI
jgi:hypothetical protein